MQCHYAAEIFSDYIAGDIERALAVSLENHLAGCAACREQVEGLRRVWTALDRLPIAAPPPFFHENLMQRIAQAEAQGREQTLRRRALWDWRALLRPRGLAYAAATLILLLACVEAVQVQRAELGPLGWAVQRARSVPKPVATLELQTAMAQWTPAPAGGGTLVVHLRAQPSPDGRTNLLRYTLRRSKGDNGPIVKQGVLTSDRETVLTQPLDAPPADGAVVATVSWPNAEGSDDQSASRDVAIPITQSEIVPQPAPTAPPPDERAPHSTPAPE